eukprot:TRINITY_DN1088_c0_g1_i1.p1 TRINITY_DN1088_c0_g1~~TRINITY_DN1088_c0_g1_i1.p1  ORF type:complete len:519 (+),score=74.16 TRINITY_DN1088_c0_g1_i1:183-1559(+)
MNFEEAACEEVLDEPSGVQRKPRSLQDELMASGDHVSLRAVASTAKHDPQPAQRVHCSHVHEIVAMRNRNRNRLRSSTPRVNCLQHEEWEALRKRMHLSGSSSSARSDQQPAQPVNRSRDGVLLAPRNQVNSDASDIDSNGECENLRPQRRNCLQHEEWEALRKRMPWHRSASRGERDQQPAQLVNRSHLRGRLAPRNQISLDASDSDAEGECKNMRPQRVNCLQHEEWEALRKRMLLSSSASREERGQQPVQPVNRSHRRGLLAPRNQISLDASDSDAEGECKNMRPQRVNCLQHEEWETLRKGMNLHGSVSSGECDQQPAQHVNCSLPAPNNQVGSDACDSDSDGECENLRPQRRNCLQHEEWEALLKRMNLHGASSAASDSTPTPHIASSEAARSRATESNVLQHIFLADNTSQAQKQQIASEHMGSTALGSQESYDHSAMKLPDVSDSASMLMN